MAKRTDGLLGCVGKPEINENFRRANLKITEINTEIENTLDGYNELCDDLLINDVTAFETIASIFELLVQETTNISAYLLKTAELKASIDEMYKRVPLRVNFYLGGGQWKTPRENFEYLKGSHTLNKIDEVEKDNAVFVGWFKGDNNTTFPFGVKKTLLITLPYEVEGDTNLRAVWSPPTVTMELYKFNPAGNYEFWQNFECVPGVTTLADLPTEDGFQFWTTSSSKTKLTAQMQKKDNAIIPLQSKKLYHFST